MIEKNVACDKVLHIKFFFFKYVLLPFVSAPIVFMSSIARSIEADQDMLEIIAAIMLHQSLVPIKS